MLATFDMHNILYYILRPVKGVLSHPAASDRVPRGFSGGRSPRYLLHDRDHAFAAVATTAAGMGIQEIPSAPRSPWQNAYAERVIGPQLPQFEPPRQSGSGLVSARRTEVALLTFDAAHYDHRLIGSAARMEFSVGTGSGNHESGGRDRARQAGGFREGFFVGNGPITVGS